LKRYAAGIALLRAGGKGQLPTVRKLLKDAHEGVRRRIALALLEARDKEAIPTLIALLTARTSEDASLAEEALTVLAGEKAPAYPENDTAEARAKYRKAWDAWWEKAGGTLDLARIDLTQIGHGYTLVALLDLKGRGGKVQCWDTTGKVLWTMTGLNYPMHASLIRRDRVLVCEGARVTERDLTGKIYWEKTIAGQILSAQRLRNGRTLIVARNLIVEVDRKGTEVKSVTRPFDVVAAERHPDGKMTILTNAGQVIRMDAAGRQVSSFATGSFLHVIGLKAHFLPTGGVVIPDYSRNKVREYDASGKMIREFDAQRPSWVVRLPNGNTLVGTRLLRNRIYEIDPKGKEVNPRTVDGRILFLDRR
jgi:ketosteroid isomerase-like protein